MDKHKLHAHTIILIEWNAALHAKFHALVSFNYSFCIWWRKLIKVLEHHYNHNQMWILCIYNSICKFKNMRSRRLRRHNILLCWKISMNMAHSTRQLLIKLYVVYYGIALQVHHNHVDVIPNIYSLHIAYRIQSVCGMCVVHIN